MQKKLLIIKESKAFQFVVTAIILLSSVIVGIGTYELSNDIYFRELFGLDYFITTYYVIEISNRYFAENKKVNFLKMDGIYLIIIVISSLIPTTGSSVLVLRLLRLARLLRVISFMPELRFVIEALIESLKKAFMF